ncbi:hypothetical protein [Nocardioides sp. TF02-7]|uniref:hypothetical protein n=1 Tax=Nocardioides sp. TF02-7 TaxID=2917724 RepID=UPI001F051422|nr:hypothetical protein [Nocardioides sp. TF02-7]UMG91909.1 hypothetical protein MF408_18065 [Nocardioides sp. TF02-7]
MGDPLDQGELAGRDHSPVFRGEVEQLVGERLHRHLGLGRLGLDDPRRSRGGEVEERCGPEFHEI